MKGIYLQELEPMFAEMKSSGVQADEKTQAATFWAQAKKNLADMALMQTQLMLEI